MLFQKNTPIYSSIALLTIIATGLCSSISVAFDKTDSATEKLKEISSDISSNDLEEIRNLIEMGADVNVSSEGDITTLHGASFHGYAEIIKLLLDAGADVNAESSLGITPLHMASVMGHLETVNVLLDAGAKVNAALVDDRTSLILAVEKGYPDVVNVLLDAGANVNTTPDSRRTPLHVASEKGYIEIVKLLLAAGADVNPTYLVSGSSKVNPEFVKFLFEAGVTVRYDPLAHRTPLILATENGDIGIIKLLLEAGADVNATPTENRRTPLHIASMGGYIDIVKLLLAAGADVNVKDVIFLREEEPIMSPPFSADSTQERLFTVISSDDRTPLIMASQSGHAEIVRLLVEAGAKVNARTSNDATSLILASEKGHIEVVELLLEAGAKTNYKVAIQDERYTALDLAEINGHTEIAKLLRIFSGE